MHYSPLATCPLERGRSSWDRGLLVFTHEPLEQVAAEFNRYNTTKIRVGDAEAAQLRELAAALQAILAQSEERNALPDEFLDLCTMHGESHPGEARLARTFLARIERGEVGSPTEPERKPW